MDNHLKNSPNIRFPGYTDPWEQRKFGDLVLIERGGSPRPIDDFITDSPVGLNWVKIGDAPDHGRYINSTKEKIKPEGLSKTRQVQPGDLILSNSMSFGRPYIMGIHGCIHDGWLLIRNEQNIFDLTFLCHMLGTDQMLDQYRMYAAGSTVNNLNKELVGNTFVSIPSISEQRKIGQFLEQVDAAITLHQRKCDELKNYKKGLLQQMFPQAGELVPRIRFPGFTEPWEQRKFSDFTWNAGKRNSQNLDLEPYAVTNDRGFIRQNEAHDEFGYMKDVDRKAYNIVMPNSFAYNPARINVGSIGYYEGAENVIVSSLYEVFQTADYVDDRFLWHWFKSDIFPKWIERLQEGSVRLYFYYDKLCECKMLMPSLPEQKKIAATLDEIDNLITLHQCKYCQDHTGVFTIIIKLNLACFTATWEQHKLGDVVKVCSGKDYK
nr:restriction endonuclease subunit S [Saccharofermentans sp.]